MSDHPIEVAPGEQSMLAAALDYLRRGWSIIPMRPGTKQPACKWKPFQTALPSEDQLRRWFGNGKRYNLGTIFGTSSNNLGQRDFDELAAYEHWAAEHPDLATSLPTVATMRGRHVYFQTVPKAVATLRAGLGRPDGIGAIHCTDGELRIGHGCYSVLPPSRRSNGFAYTWLIAPADEIPVVEDLIAAGFIRLNREATAADARPPAGDAGGAASEHPCFSIRCNRESRESPGHKEKDDGVEQVADSLNEATTPPPTLTSCLLVSLESLYSQHSLLHEKVQQAIDRTIPTGGGKRHRAIFDLARELRAFPELADASPLSLRPVVEQWHRQALPYVKSKAFEETWLDFVEGWAKVKYPKGQGPLDQAFQKGLQAELPEVARQYEQQPLRLLVSLCRELQRANPDRPLFLSSREAGRLLDVSHVQASRWLRLLQVDRVLQLVSLGTNESGAASRYRYLPALD